MDKALHCHCGFEARAAGEAELVVEVQRHAWQAHGMRLTDEEALLVAFRVQLDEGAAIAVPRVHHNCSRSKEETP